MIPKKMPTPALKPNASLTDQSGTLTCTMLGCSKAMLARSGMNSSAQIAIRPAFMGRPTPTALGQPAADDLLGQALAHLPPIDVGGVKEVDAQLVGPVHDAEAVGLRGVGPEVHRAQAKPTHLQPGPAWIRVLHRALLTRMSATAGGGRQPLHHVLQDLPRSSKPSSAFRERI
jgi:hypothetical protein